MLRVIIATFVIGLYTIIPYIIIYHANPAFNYY